MRRRRNGPGGLDAGLSPGLSGVAGGGDGTGLPENFEDYADDAELQERWTTPGASFSATLHTSSPIESTTSCEITDSAHRVTSEEIVTSEGHTYTTLMRFDGGVGGNPGFYTHAQDTSAPFDDQVLVRVETPDTLGVYVREGGAYNASSTATITESLATGTVYRLELLADAGTSTAEAAIYNTSSGAQIGAASCTYSTAWTGGSLGLFGDAVSGTQVYDTIDEGGSTTTDTYGGSSYGSGYGG